MRVALAIPSFDSHRAEGENLGIGYVGAALKYKNIDVTIVNHDGTLEKSEIVSRIAKFRPNLIGIGLPSYHLLPNLFELSDQIKRQSNTPIVIGGHYVLFQGKEILRQCASIDIAVLGEGEETIVEIVDLYINGGSFESIQGIAYRSEGEIRKTPLRRSVENLDLLADPIRRPGYKVYNISASRGCYTHCSFCSVPQFNRTLPGKALRLRSIESIDREVRLLAEQGARAISFIDDVFLLPKTKGKDRAFSIADIMSKYNVKWAFSCRTPELTSEIASYCVTRGLCNIGLGLESGSPSVLGRFSKRASLEHSTAAIHICNKFGISITPYFIMFEPDMTLDDLRISIEFLDHFGLLWPSFAGNVLEPFPGTTSYSDLVRQDRIRFENGRYVAKFSCSRVHEIYLKTKDALHEERTAEFKLRRAMFEAQLDNRPTKDLQCQLRQLSSQTKEYMLTVFNDVLRK